MQQYSHLSIALTTILKMRISDILGVAACFTLTSALPTVNTVRSGQAVSVTFIGAAGAQYTIDVPLNSPATLTSKSHHNSSLSTPTNQT